MTISFNYNLFLCRKFFATFYTTYFKIKSKKSIKYNQFLSLLVVSKKIEEAKM